MAVNPDFIVATDLSNIFLDKDTGEPLSGGTISFFLDSDHVTPKLVYTIQNQNPALPPNYTYVPMPNPITLSATGQVQDNNGNNVPIYYFPFDANGNIQLYYIVVNNANGVQQFTRQAWPNLSTQNNPANAQKNLVNLLSNPQFSDIGFTLTNPVTLSFPGPGVTTIPFGADWSVVITSTGNGTVTLQRNSIAGSSAYPDNPPYTLTVTPGVNISALQLKQTLIHNPDILSPAPGGTNGYIASSILLAPGSSVSMSYQPNGQAAQQILIAGNVSANYQTFNNTVQLSAATNPSNADTGFVDILINLPVNVATTLSNVQVVGVDFNIPIPYNQVPVNRETDQIFNYYSPLLNYKRTPSYLVGWDFAYNPSQIFGNGTIQVNSGNNTSFYAWDQTIVFQSISQGPTIQRNSINNAFDILRNVNGSQNAIIQYLPATTAREILRVPLSVNVAALTPIPGGMVCTVSLWYTTDANLPSTVVSNNSLVASLNANGKPVTFHGNWVEIPRELGDATFTILNATTVDYNDYSLSGWNTVPGVGSQVATYFAIVVGFSALTSGLAINIGSISLVPGRIPTRPAVQSQDEVLRECQRYYEKSFPVTVLPAQNVGTNTGEFLSNQILGASTANQLVGSVPFKVEKNVTPSLITTYNPAAANAQIRNETVPADCSVTAVSQSSTQSFALTCTTPMGSAAGNILGVHWTADSRLGY